MLCVSEQYFTYFIFYNIPTALLFAECVVFVVVWLQIMYFRSVCSWHYYDNAHYKFWLYTANTFPNHNYIVFLTIEMWLTALVVTCIVVLTWCNAWSLGSIMPSQEFFSVAGFCIAYLYTNCFVSLISKRKVIIER